MDGRRLAGAAKRAHDMEPIHYISHLTPRQALPVLRHNAVLWCCGHACLACLAASLALPPINSPHPPTHHTPRRSPLHPRPVLCCAAPAHLRCLALRCLLQGTGDARRAHVVAHALPHALRDVQHGQPEVVQNLPPLGPPQNLLQRAALRWRRGKVGLGVMWWVADQGGEVLPRFR